MYKGTLKVRGHIFLNPTRLQHLYDCIAINHLQPFNDFISLDGLLTHPRKTNGSHRCCRRRRWSGKGGRRSAVENKAPHHCAQPKRMIAAYCLCLMILTKSGTQIRIECNLRQNRLRRHPIHDIPTRSRKDRHCHIGHSHDQLFQLHRPTEPHHCGREIECNETVHSQ